MLCPPTLLSEVVVFTPNLIQNRVNAFLPGIKTKKFGNITEKFFFASLRIINLSIKFIVNPFIDVALTFFDSLSNLFLFDVTLADYQNLLFF